MNRLAVVILLALALAPASASADPSPTDQRAYDSATTKLERAIKTAEACGNDCGKAVALRVYSTLHGYEVVMKRVADHQGCRSTYPSQPGARAEALMHAWALQPTRSNHVKAVLAYRRYAARLGRQILTCWYAPQDPGGNLLPE